MPVGDLSIHWRYHPLISAPSSSADSADVRERTAASDLGGVSEALQHPQDLRVLRLNRGQR